MAPSTIPASNPPLISCLVDHVSQWEEFTSFPAATDIDISSCANRNSKLKWCFVLMSALPSSRSVDTWLPHWLHCIHIKNLLWDQRQLSIIAKALEEFLSANGRVKLKAWCPSALVNAGRESHPKDKPGELLGAVRELWLYRDPRETGLLNLVYN